MITNLMRIALTICLMTVFGLSAQAKKKTSGYHKASKYMSSGHKGHAKKHVSSHGSKKAQRNVASVKNKKSKKHGKKKHRY